jgi:hypothetical protein
MPDQKLSMYAKFIGDKLGLVKSSKKEDQFYRDIKVGKFNGPFKQEIA